MLLDVYETVYKVRTTLLALKNSPRTSQVQPSAKQVPLLLLTELDYYKESFVSNNIQLNICT